MDFENYFFGDGFGEIVTFSGNNRFLSKSVSKKLIFKIHLSKILFRGIKIRLALKLGTLLIRDIELINFSRRLKSRNINLSGVNSERYTFAYPQSAECVLLHQYLPVSDCWHLLHLYLIQMGSLVL